jgi:hypothetical protein
MRKRNEDNIKMELRDIGCEDGCNWFMIVFNGLVALNQRVETSS